MPGVAWKSAVWFCLAPAMWARAVELYHFTPIAETGQTYTNLDYPAINDAGEVAFTATPASHPQVQPYAIYIGNGQTTAVYYPWPSPFHPHVHSVHLNDAGYFAYIGRNLNDRGIVRANASTAEFVLLQMGGGSYYGPNSINESNQILTSLIEFGGRGVIYRAEPDGPLTQIADTSGPFQTLGSCAMNDHGSVAISVITDTNERLLILSDGGPAQTLYSNAGPIDRFHYVSINNSGLIGFSAQFDDGRFGILTGDGGPPQLLADTSGLYDTFGFMAINDRGDVVFEATTDSGAKGVFIGPDPVSHRVLATGDALLGSTVHDLAFIDGLNGSGQVALRAVLSDGRTAIIRADPIPEPEASLMLTLGLAVLRWRVRAGAQSSA